VLSGKRFLSLKKTDIEFYLGSRAKRGTLLPRGFQRVDAITLEE
jgi:topoisomerase-4 subunit A